MSNDNPSNDKLDVVRKFSEFWSVVGNRRHIQTDRRLKQLMMKLTDGLSEDDPVTDDAWARYLLLLTYQHDAEFVQSLKVPVHDLAALITKLIQLRECRNAKVKCIHDHLDKPSQTYAEELSSKNRDLLIAYLQEPAYSAASTLYRRLGLKLALEECAAIAACVISQPFSLLKPFKFDWDNTIKTFLKHKLPDKLRDEIDDRSIRDKTRNQSKTSQLKQGSRNRKKILDSAGYANGKLERHDLLWDCYQEIHAPRQEGRKPLPDPSPEQWQAIAECFNQRLECLGATADKTRIDQATAERMMNDCRKAVQDWSNFKLLSLDAPLKSSDPDAGDLQDSIQDSQNLTPIDYMLYLEQQEDEEKIPSTIVQAFAQLSDIEQAALVLWRGLNFGQDYVVELLGKPKGFKANSDVSRIVKNPLSKALLESWCRDIHHDDPKKLRELHAARAKEVVTALKINLPQHCRNWLVEFLTAEYQSLVHLHSDSSSSSLRDDLKQKLLDRLHVTKLDAVPDADQRITAFIDSWLQAHSPHPAI
ncbi:MAG: hypothetical protein NZ772_01490 [Cyanobacteria bacterium]|nr:hypothetical protein [Cyanobacteriota bacterium]MDW8199800.1 hypothetical protein [Cyanobacteriota bacterium SKYGB_h_bin112]